MKLQIGKRQHDKRKSLEKWHKWFAWKPVKVGTFEYRWLEFVHRRFNTWFVFEYKPFDPGQREN